MNGGTLYLSFDPGGHGINEARQCRGSQTITRFVEICKLELGSLAATPGFEGNMRSWAVLHNMYRQGNVGSSYTYFLNQGGVVFSYLTRFPSNHYHKGLPMFLFDPGGILRPVRARCPEVRNDILAEHGRSAQTERKQCDWSSKVDKGRMIVKVEPLVDLSQITRVIVPMNLALTVAAKLANLTVGGLIHGAGMKGSAHVLIIGSGSTLFEQREFYYIGIMDRHNICYLRAGIWSFIVTEPKLALGHASYSKRRILKVLLMTVHNDPPGVDYDLDKFSKSFNEMAAMCLVKGGICIIDMIDAQCENDLVGIVVWKTTPFTILSPKSTCHKHSSRKQNQFKPWRPHEEQVNVNVHAFQLFNPGGITYLSRTRNSVSHLYSHTSTLFVSNIVEQKIGLNASGARTFVFNVHMSETSLQIYTRNFDAEFGFGFFSPHPTTANGATLQLLFMQFSFMARSKGVMFPFHPGENYVCTFSFNLTRGRVIPLEGWNNEYDPDVEGKFIMAKVHLAISSCVNTLCKNGQSRESLRLFHNVVNGLDPPMDLNGACEASMWIPMSSLVDELLRRRDGLM